MLDGHLLGEYSAKVNLFELLDIASREFKAVKTFDEEGVGARLAATVRCT